MQHPAQDVLETSPDGDVAEVFDLLTSEGEDPILSAERQLRPLGDGENAFVYEHPSDPDLVVRVSTGNDGWIQHADAAMRMSKPSAFLPVVFGIAHLQVGRYDRWISISERLDEFHDYGAGSLIAALKHAILPGYYGPLEPSHSVLMEERQPGLLAALQQYASTAWEDLDAANFMRRDGTLVINDPIAEITTRDIKLDLVTRYGTGLQLEPDEGLKRAMAL